MDLNVDKHRTLNRLVPIILNPPLHQASYTMCSMMCLRVSKGRCRQHPWLWLGNFTSCCWGQGSHWVNSVFFRGISRSYLILVNPHAPSLEHEAVIHSDPLCPCFITGLHVFRLVRGKEVKRLMCVSPTSFRWTLACKHGKQWHDVQGHRIDTKTLTKILIIIVFIYLFLYKPSFYVILNVIYRRAVSKPAEVCIN